MNNTYYSKLELILIDYLTNISEKTKSIYFEVPKTGCSTIKKTLQQIEVNFDDGKISKKFHHSRYLSPLKSPFDFNHNFKKLFDTDEYFKFTIVRNPYTRILSSYLDKLIMEKEEIRKDYAFSLGFNINDKISFLDFLQTLDNKDTDIFDIHWRPQVQLLPNNLQILDYIGKFENFNLCFNNILDLLQKRNTTDFKQRFNMTTIEDHKTGAGNLLKKYYTEKEKTLIKKIYKDDFKLFDYQL